MPDKSACPICAI